MSDCSTIWEISPWVFERDYLTTHRIIVVTGIEIADGTSQRSRRDNFPGVCKRSIARNDASRAALATKILYPQITGDNSVDVDTANICTRDRNKGWW